jgi:lipopolysaccharide export system protein LptA
VKTLTSHKPGLTLLLPLILILINLSSSAFSKPNASNLHVISDEMVAEQNTAMVEFKGNVKATQDDAVLLADAVKIYFYPTKEEQKGESRVKRIVATGKVEYSAGDRKALADKAVYTTADEKLVLTGKSPKLLTGKSWVTGKKITLFRNQERVMVESDGKKRVEAFFDSQDQKKGQ